MVNNSTSKCVTGSYRCQRSLAYTDCIMSCCLGISVVLLPITVAMLLVSVMAVSMIMFSSIGSAKRVTSSEYHQVFSPCRKDRTRILSARPALPTIRIHFGSWTCTSAYISAEQLFYSTHTENSLSRVIFTNRSTACTRILTPSARRNTPLKKAPNIVARCQPYVYCCGADLARSCNYLV